MYQEIDGGYEGSRGEGLERVNGGFPQFESWLLSKKLSDASTSIGVDLIGMAKTNTKGFCKATIEGLKKDWTGRSYIVLRSKPMVPGGKPQLAIGYK